VYGPLRESVLTCEATVVKAVFSAVGDANTNKRISIPSNIPISPTKALESVKGLSKILKTKAENLVSMFSEIIQFPVDFQANIPELGIEAKIYVLQMSTIEAGKFAFWTSPLRLDKKLHLTNHVASMVADALHYFPGADSLTLNQLVPYLVESRYKLLAPILDNLKFKVFDAKKRKLFDASVESLKDECTEQRKRLRPVEEVVIPNIIRLIGDVLGADQYRYAPAGTFGPDFQGLSKEDIIEKRKRAVPRYATVVCLDRMGDVIVFLKRLVDIMVSMVFKVINILI
jgi:hypothetical protein